MKTKSFTDLEQSKKLAEILPIESADIWYSIVDDEPFVCLERHYEYEQIPCWSLAALLDILKCFDPDIMFLQSTFDGRGTHLANVWRLSLESLDITIRDIYADNFVDACYEMITKLNELNLL